MPVGYEWECKFCGAANEAGVTSCASCGKPAIARPIDVARASSGAAIAEADAPLIRSMIAFARFHRVALRNVFAGVALFVVALFIANAVWPGLTPEPWGWMLLFGSLPWSLVGMALGNLAILGVVIIPIGLAFNATVATFVAWYVLSRWWSAVKSD
jgi:hypothetical protein